MPCSVDRILHWLLIWGHGWVLVSGFYCILVVFMRYVSGEWVPGCGNLLIFHRVKWVSGLSQVTSHSCAVKWRQVFILWTQINWMARGKADLSDSNQCNDDFISDDFPLIISGHRFHYSWRPADYSSCTRGTFLFLQWIVDGNSHFFNTSSLFFSSWISSYCQTD